MRYEYMELERASAEDINTYGAGGWHVVAGQWLPYMTLRNYADLPEGWTVLMERQIPPAPPRDPFKEAANGS